MGGESDVRCNDLLCNTITNGLALLWCPFGLLLATDNNLPARHVGIH